MGAFEDLAIPDQIADRAPRWVTGEAYPEKHQDMLNDLYSVAWWQEVCQLRSKQGEIKPESMMPAEWLGVITGESNGDWPLIQRELGQAAAKRAVVQADVLKQDFGQVFLEACWSVNTRKLWVGGREEYDTFEEFLIDKMPRLKEAGSEGELYEVMFLMEHFLPTMQQVGGDFEPEKLMELPEHWSRARRAVPYLRAKVSKVKAHLEDVQNHTEVGEEISKEFAAAVDNVVKTVADTTIPRDGPTGISQKLFKLDGGNSRPDPVDGYTAILPRGKVLVFFTIPAGWQRTVEHSLRTTVKFEAIDTEPGFDKLDKALHPKKARSNGK